MDRGTVGGAGDWTTPWSRRQHTFQTWQWDSIFEFLEQNLRTVQVAERKKLWPGEKIPPAAPSPFYRELYGENTQSAQVWARPKVRSRGQAHRRPLEPEAKVWEACSCHEVSWKKLQVVEEPWSQGQKCQKDQSWMHLRAASAGERFNGEDFLGGGWLDRCR